MFKQKQKPYWKRLVEGSVRDRRALPLYNVQ